MTELRWIMPIKAITPSKATKPKGLSSTNKAPATPAIPRGPVTKTNTARLKLCNCSINKVKVINNMTGKPAEIELDPLELSSTAPATSMRYMALSVVAHLASKALSWGKSSWVTVAPCRPSMMSHCTVMAYSRPSRHITPGSHVNTGLMICVAGIIRPVAVGK